MRSSLMIVAAVATGVGIGGGVVSATAGDARAPAPMAATALQPTVVTPQAPRPVVARAARSVLEGVGVESGAEKSRVQVALDALSRRVGRQSDPNALKMAFRAYYNYKAAHPEKVRKPYLYYVDYGLGSKTPRGWVFDMEALKVVDGPFTVAHGRGSAPTADGVPTRFSNRQGSNSTSLGLYLAQETYNFSGKSGGRRYTSVGLRLAGLSGKYNSAARARGVVVHGAPYVSRTASGRSEGCPAVEQSRARTLLPKIAHGGLVFLFSPRDKGWMQADPWANRG